MHKSILFVNQSSGYLMVDIINAHVDFYDEIVLLTGFLNPRETPLHSKVKVIKLIEYKRSSALKRLLTWIGFWFQSLFYVFVKYKRSKLYFVSNPPLNIFTASRLKRDFAFLIYDLYPQALSKNNILSESSWFYKKWENANSKIYRSAKRLFTLSDGMKKAMDIPISIRDNMLVVPIWTNNTFFKKIKPDKNKFIKQEKLENKFIVSYSGNLGKTHPVEILIDLAERLVDFKDIFFLIIGEGEKKNLLKARQEKLKLPNLKILDFQPTYLFPHVLAAADIGVVTLEVDASDLSVPSKTFNLMSAGKPILSISSETSELSKLISTYAIGQNFSESQVADMADFILKLKNNPDIYEDLKNLSKKASLDFSAENAKKLILK